MRVQIVCEKCDARTEIHVIGSWERVVHSCERDLGTIAFRGRLLPTGKFGVTYDPPRRAF